MNPYSARYRKAKSVSVALTHGSVPGENSDVHAIAWTLLGRGVDGGPADRLEQYAPNPNLRRPEIDASQLDPNEKCTERHGHTGLHAESAA
ncbi:hypothetical protein Pen02_82980 [Plantactinospora endophytica]|uniref:Transposase IS66 C-terminal domain-containing protein n=1 Tax=Plantactinospora endophytica TaxID=673535 RepID=A0ABQ4EGL4_9ACTN|nr:hypothetical protein Pen02_82980 [Plantactinospora endophytica]